MVQLRILSGIKKGQHVAVADYPWVIGRSPQAHLRLEEGGVWDQHAQLQMDHALGVQITCLPEAIATLNGELFQKARLRNGDVIELGSARLQFWLSEARQRGIQWREAFTWLLLMGICLLQVGLIYWLER